MSILELRPAIAHWRNQDAMYGLIGQACQLCDIKIFPPKPVCPECGSTTLKPYQFSGSGEVYTYSRVNNPPASHEDQAPYTTALIKLKEGPLITAGLTDIDLQDVKIGLPVEMVTRVLSTNGDLGRINYGYKFRPLLLG